MRSSSMILRKWRMEKPAISAAVGISKNIFTRTGVLVAVSVNIVSVLPFAAYIAFALPMSLRLVGDLLYLHHHGVRAAAICYRPIGAHQCRNRRCAVSQSVQSRTRSAKVLRFVLA